MLWLAQLRTDSCSSDSISLRAKREGRVKSHAAEENRPGSPLEGGRRPRGRCPSFPAPPGRGRQREASEVSDPSLRAGSVKGGGTTQGGTPEAPASSRAKLTLIDDRQLPPVLCFQPNQT